MKLKDLKSLPFDGLFVLYKRNENGLTQKVDYGFCSDDIPEKFSECTIKAVYPMENSIAIDLL